MRSKRRGYSRAAPLRMSSPYHSRRSRGVASALTREAGRQTAERRGPGMRQALRGAVRKFLIRLLRVLAERVVDISRSTPGVPEEKKEKRAAPPRRESPVLRRPPSPPPSLPVSRARATSKRRSRERRRISPRGPLSPATSASTSAVVVAAPSSENQEKNDDQEDHVHAAHLLSKPTGASCPAGYFHRIEWARDRIGEPGSQDGKVRAATPADRAGGGRPTPEPDESRTGCLYVRSGTTEIRTIPSGDFSLVSRTREPISTARSMSTVWYFSSRSNVLVFFSPVITSIDFAGL